MLRKYSSETDYPIVLENAKAEGRISVAGILIALSERGIRGQFIFNDSKDPDMIQLDKDISRAWIECGYRSP